MSIIDDASSLQDELIRLRRTLHRNPEVGLHLPRTQDTVLAALDGLPLELTLGAGLSSITGVLRGGLPGPTVLLRADMDALPLREQTGLDWASRGDTMHACGHDLHAAMLVGAAHLLSARRETLTGDVVFMFQPGEEGFDGARLMIEEGVLEASGTRPVAAYGLHVSSSELPRMVYSTRRGPLMAATENVHVRLYGAGGHGSSPHTCRDPIPAACEMVGALQTLVTRRFSAFDPVVLSVCRMSSGTAANIIPDLAEFEATLRTFSAEAHQRARDGIVAVCEGIAAAHDLRVEIDFTDAYPVTVNDAAETEFAAEVITDLNGEGNLLWAPEPSTASEDFSRVLAEVPGSFVFLGACPPDRDPRTAPDNHSSLAEFDDAVLGSGAATLATLARRRLTRSDVGQPDPDQTPTHHNAEEAS